MTSRWQSLPVRDDLRDWTPYGAPQIAAPVALNVNENTHPVPPDVIEDIVQAVRGALTTVNRYPDREFPQLRADFARYLGDGVTADQVWAANGSNEVLLQLLQAFAGSGRSAMGFAPTYSMYPLLARITGAGWIAGSRRPDFTLDAADAAAQVDRARPDVVILCSPNNPTGTPLDLDVVTAVYEATSGIVVVDEAYHEFTPPGTPSATSLLPERERLVVSRTMSKAFAFAGARVGYLAADPALIDALRLVRLPYHLSSLTQAAARAALAHAPVMLRTVADIARQRDRIVAALPGLGYSPYPTWANFVLFGGVSNSRRAWRRLYESGVLVRDIGMPGHLRVSAGTAAETDAFLAAIASIESPA